MANGSKQSHSKSRNVGCGQCKRRRVRCNCQGPICSNCHRRNELCDYLRGYDSQSPETKEPQSHTHVTLFESSHASRQMRVISSTEEYSYFSSCTELFVALDHYLAFVNEQELLAYATPLFLKTDWASFTPSQNDLLVWKGDHGYQNNTLGYLLPTISSLCAIHQTMRQEPLSSHAHATALEHNITASAKFRHAERSVHEGNWLPILMFGVGHIMFNFAAAQSAPDRDFEYLDIFHVLRSSAKIGGEIGVFLEKSELNDMLEFKRRRFAEPSEPDDSLRAISQLSLAQHPEGTPETTRRHCQCALQRLEWWTRFVHGAPQTWKHFILWPASVTDGFVTALVEKQPVALLVFIYWCVVMHRAPRRWYANGWHQRVAVAAMSELGSEYWALLEWPSLTLNSPLMTDVASLFPVATTSHYVQA
ncbi:hypothetical protein F5Y12DRAFT_520412 [Xylaria sp. FL1777]|nr:hypothetical protein F5Y12DRAFT_520412 [Xylaria sp. FL1777]